MSSHERHESLLGTDILAGLDHAMVADMVVDSLIAEGSVSQRVKNIWDIQEKIDPELVHAVFEIGRFVQPVDPQLGVDSDANIWRVFLSGSMVALDAMEKLAAAIAIDPADMRDQLRRRHLMVLDVSRLSDDISPAEKFARVGQGIVQTGQYQLDRLDPAYQVMIDVVADNYPETALHPNVFRSAFGYLFGAGCKAMADLLSQRQADELLVDFDFDGELAHLLGEEL